MHQYPEPLGLCSRHAVAIGSVPPRGGWRARDSAFSFWADASIRRVAGGSPAHAKPTLRQWLDSSAMNAARWAPPIRIKPGIRSPLSPRARVCAGGAGRQPGEPRLSGCRPTPPRSSLRSTALRLRGAARRRRYPLVRRPVPSHSPGTHRVAPAPSPRTAWRLLRPRRSLWFVPA